MKKFIIYVLAVLMASAGYYCYFVYFTYDPKWYTILALFAAVFFLFSPALNFWIGYFTKVLSDNNKANP